MVDPQHGVSAVFLGLHLSLSPDIGAREARLSIMVGGERVIVDAIRPMLDCMGRNIQHMGPAGNGRYQCSSVS